MLDPNSRAQTPKVSTRASTSAPPVLGGWVDIKHKKSKPQAKTSNTFVKISPLNQLPSRPHSHRFWIPSRSKTSHEKNISDMSLPLQFGKNKGNTHTVCACTCIIWLHSAFDLVLLWSSLSPALKKPSQLSERKQGRGSGLGPWWGKVKALLPSCFAVIT